MSAVNKNNNIERTNTVIVNGGGVLKGSVSAQGSKNAALPILAALPLIPKIDLYNVPNLSDIYEMVNILDYLGGESDFKNGVLHFDSKNITCKPIVEEFANKMRASSLFLGTLLAKYGEASVGMPGGCVIGSRPLDIHIEGFKTLGATVDIDNGFVNVTGKRLEGEYTLPFPSVGATQNLITACVFSPSKVVLHNVAVEPEVMEVVHFLNKAGAKIKLDGSNTIVIKGVKKLKSLSFSVQSDRIEAYTLIVAALASKGNIKVTNCDPEHLSAPLQTLMQMGADIKIGKDYIKASYVEPLQGSKVSTGVYPGFPTDCQQQVSSLMVAADSSSTVVENVFNNRLRHLDELRKMGADIQIENNVAVVNPSTLKGCRIDSFDLRGAASMIIAGLMAEGVTEVSGMEYLYRGYENYVEKLNYLGANINYKKMKGKVVS